MISFNNSMMSVSKHSHDASILSVQSSNRAKGFKHMTKEERELKTLKTETKERLM